jgi:hypothetical protein
MRYQQKGFIPLLSKLFGIAIFVYPLPSLFVFAVSKTLTNHAPIDIVFTFMAVAIVLLFPVWLSLFLVKMFPSIELTDEGIHCISIGLVKTLIRWNEIESLFQFKNGYLGLVFNKPGAFFLNSSYYNILYGMVIRRDAPVLFLSPNTENLEGILSTIFEHSNAKSVRKYRR